jgi:hypothetical protein
MLTATRANVLIPNRRTTAITNHLSFSLSYTSILHLVSALSNEKNREKKKFFWHDICYAAFGTRFALACHFGRKRAPPAILAVPLP